MHQRQGRPLKFGLIAQPPCCVLTTIIIYVAIGFRDALAECFPLNEQVTERQTQP